MKDYYKILEVNKDASQEIISKVYKILAKKYHPDLQNDQNKSTSEEKFKEISEAYEILSDEEKRKEYDNQLESYKQANSIDINDYETLKNYCIQLENEINNLRNSFSASDNTNSENIYSSFDSQRMQYAEQEAYNNAINQAYHDAYINNLRNLGYKIRYKKTFKETCKNLLALFLTGLIVFIIFKIAWAIPSLRESILSLFTI